MKKTKNGKLKLSCESLRVLDQGDLEQIAGGFVTIIYETRARSCYRSCEIKCWSDGVC